MEVAYTIHELVVGYAQSVASTNSWFTGNWLIYLQLPYHTAGNREETMVVPVYRAHVPNIIHWFIRMQPC